MSEIHLVKMYEVGMSTRFLQMRSYLFKYALIRIQRTKIWTLNEAKFIFFLFWHISVKSVYREDFFLSLHKSENTVNSQTKI